MAAAAIFQYANFLEHTIKEEGILYLEELRYGAFTDYVRFFDLHSSNSNRN